MLFVADASASDAPSAVATFIAACLLPLLPIITMFAQRERERESERVRAGATRGAARVKREFSDVRCFQRPTRPLFNELHVQQEFYQLLFHARTRANACSNAKG